jgi:hypothetical protein
MRQRRLNATVDERRIKARFRAPCLNIMLRRKSILGWRKSVIRAQCIDINRYGMAIVTPLEVSPGSRLLVDFRGKYIRESSVRAEVVSGQPYGTGYRMGLQFSYCMNQHTYCRSVDNALSRIEALYRGHNLCSVN